MRSVRLHGHPELGMYVALFSEGLSLHCLLLEQQELAGCSALSDSRCLTEMQELTMGPKEMMPYITSVSAKCCKTGAAFLSAGTAPAPRGPGLAGAPTTMYKINLQVQLLL